MLRSLLVWPVVVALSGCSLTVSLDGLDEVEGGSGSSGSAGSVSGAGGALRAGASGVGGAGTSDAGKGGGGTGGTGAAGSGSSTAGSAGQAGSAPMVEEIEACLNTSPEKIQPGLGPPITSFGASSKGLAYTFIDDGANGGRAWPGFGSGSETGNFTLPGGTMSSRLLLNDSLVFGVADDGKLGTIFGFGFDGAKPCSGGSGLVSAITHFTTCTASASAVPMAIAGNTVVVGTACGVQHVARLNGCPSDQGQLNIDDPAAKGHAVEIHALALQGGSTLYSLEQTRANDDHLTLVRKSIDFALTGEFSSVAAVASFAPGESGSDLVLGGSRLYTLVQVGASTIVASYDPAPSSPRTVLASREKHAEQLAVLGDTLYWVEQTIGSAVIWRQTSTTRQPIACVSKRIADLTVINEGVFWHDRDASSTPPIYRVDP